VRGHGAQPPLQPTPSPYPLREKVHGNVPMGEVISMMQSFQRMIYFLTKRLNQEASGISILR
jgi:hypothetical protein